jgi:Dehydrogenases (flavoproteins)
MTINLQSISKIYDVIVAGGGLSGVAGAVAAAREGTKVLLVEQYGFLGGMATTGLVNPFMPYWIINEGWKYDYEKEINSGIFAEILKSLSELGGLHENKMTFNEEILKIVLDRMIKKSNVKVLLHSFVLGVAREGNAIKSIEVISKTGKAEYNAHYYIDATGDADLAALAGCRYKIGRPADGQCQPLTLCFRIGNINLNVQDMSNITDVINRKYREKKAKGLIHNPRENVLIFSHMVDNVIHLNSTRIVGRSAVDAEELTTAETEAREQMYELYLFLKENIRGFENSQILMSGPQIGVRESRRIEGEYTIKKEDLLGCVKFEDSIARGNYGVDIHNPSGSGTTLEHIPYGDYYTIPYRALLPKDVENLIIAGRPISSTHEAHSAYRVMPICTCIGEGAGTAAAIACRDGISFKEVNPEKIQESLEKYGALY